MSSGTTMSGLHSLRITMLLKDVTVVGILEKNKRVLLRRNRDGSVTSCSIAAFAALDYAPKLGDTFDLGYETECGIMRRLVSLTNFVPTPMC